MRLNGYPLHLEAGDLTLIHPDDQHAISVLAGRELEFVNIAFPHTYWERFSALVQLSPEVFSARSKGPPMLAHVSIERRDACQRVFQRALLAFHEGPSQFELCVFLARSLPFLLEPTGMPDSTDIGLPAWLRRARRAMREEDNLRMGLSRFVELSGVSPAHLARTLRTHTGQTPTEFILELRLEHAALLLATTPRAIAHIAADCGFDSLSYFYRMFGMRFGSAPRAYQLKGLRSVVPGG